VGSGWNVLLLSRRSGLPSVTSLTDHTKAEWVERSCKAAERRPRGEIHPDCGM
jgi:hypothetical protein